MSVPERFKRPAGISSRPETEIKRENGAAETPLFSEKPNEISENVDHALIFG